MAPTNVPTGRARRWVPAFALAPLAVVPGCLTADLWRDYAWPEPTVTHEPLDRRDHQAAGELAVSLPVLESGLRWSDARGSEHWWLYPRGWDGVGAEMAAALLEDAELCEVLSAAIDARRRVVVDEEAENDTWLELELRLRGGAIGHPVPATDVAPAAARVLAGTRRDAWSPATAPDAALPSVYHRCAHRLATTDLRALCGDSSPVYAESWVWVDAAGQPAAGVNLGPSVRLTVGGEERTPLAEDLAALRGLSLLVRCDSAGERRILRVRADRLWLASQLQVDGGRCTHRSKWFLQSAPRPLAAAPDASARRIVSTLRLAEERFQRWIHPVVVDGELLANVALTPVTLALDLVLGPGASDFFQWLSGGKPRPHESPRRGD